jgi:hypothetical protein
MSRSSSRSAGLANAPKSQEDTAIDAAVERRLGDLRAARVIAAEATLAKNKDRLVAAQLGEQTAARNLSLYEWSGNKTALLEARSELTIATSLVEDGERELARVKARHDPGHVEAMRQLVIAERELENFQSTLDPLLCEISELAQAMASSFNAVKERISTQGSLRNEQNRARKQLGLEPQRAATPSVDLLLGAAILRGLQAAGFPAFDWRDYDPTRVAPLPIPIPGLKAVLEPTAPFEERRKKWNASQAAQAAQADAINEREAQAREQRARDEAQERFDDQTRRLADARGKADARDWATSRDIVRALTGGPKS